MSNVDVILAFQKEFGRLPDIFDLMLMAEAEASIAIDQDENYPQTMKAMEE